MLKQVGWSRRSADGSGWLAESVSMPAVNSSSLTVGSTARSCLAANQGGRGTTSQMSEGIAWTNMLLTMAEGSGNAASEAAGRWGALYETLRPNLMRALAAASGTYEGVEDAIQDAFAAALRQSPPDLRSPEAWLFVVALNKLRNQQRRSRLAARLRLSAPPQPHELDHALSRADVVATLQRLTSLERELLIAKYYVGMSQDEIARQMRVPRGTVASAISRAAAHFRDLEERRG
jgi:RNA polymerase sigma factor (sigma-70 family)